MDMAGTQKSLITLMRAEDWLLYVQPTTTITFFRGPTEAAKRHLSNRVHEVVTANPWLGGRLVKSRGQLAA